MEGARCLRGRDKRLGFIEEGRGKIWKDHMEKVMNVESNWDHMAETNVAERPVAKVAHNKIVKAMQKMKSERQLHHLK